MFLQLTLKKSAPIYPRSICPLRKIFNLDKSFRDIIYGHFIYLSIYLSLFIYLLFRAAPVAYGSSQVRDEIGAAADGLSHSHSSLGPEPHLRPTPPLTATSVPLPAEQDQGSNPHPGGYRRGSLPLNQNGNSKYMDILNCPVNCHVFSVGFIIDQQDNSCDYFYSRRKFYKCYVQMFL